MGSNALPEPLMMVRDPEMTMITSYGLRWVAPNETAYPATFVLDINMAESHGPKSATHMQVEPTLKRSSSN